MDRSTDVIASRVGESLECALRMPSDQAASIASVTTVAPTGERPSLDGTTLPAFPDDRALPSITNVPPLKFSEVTITLDKSVKPGGDDLAIHEPFAVSALRIEDTLRQHLEQFGDRIEPNHSQARPEGILSQMWNRIAPSSARKKYTLSESFDVVRPKGDGSVVRLYTVTIEGREQGRIHVNIDRSESSGTEALAAAHQARRLLEPRISESKDVAQPLLIASETKPVECAPEIKAKYEGFAAAVAVLRAEQRQLLEENEKVRARLIELDLLPPGESLLVSEESVEELKQVETLEEQVRADLLQLVERLEEGKVKLTPKSDGSLELAAFSYSIQRPGYFKKVDRELDALNYFQRHARANCASLSLAGVVFGLCAIPGFCFELLCIYLGVAHWGKPGWPFAVGAAAYFLATCIWTGVVCSMKEAKLDVSLERYQRRLTNAIRLLHTSSTKGSLGEILDKLQKARISVQLEVIHPRFKECFERRGEEQRLRWLQIPNCRVKLSLFYREEQAR